MQKITSVDLKNMFLKKGITQAQIAKDLGVSRAFVCLVVSGKNRSRRVEKAIAELINMSPADIWPLTV